MRIFWSIIVGLLISAGVILLRSEDGGAVRTTSTATRTSTVSPNDRLNAIARDAATSRDDDAAAPGDDRITAKTWTLTDGQTLQEISRRRYGDARLWRRIVDANPALAASVANPADMHRAFVEYSLNAKLGRPPENKCA